MKRWLSHPWTLRVSRWGLGLVFLAAALPKIADPPSFAKAIWAYELFPGWSLHPLALVLPWLELLCGGALCLNLWTRAAAAWTATLLLAFSLAIGINLARQHPVDCGCFGAAVPRTQAQRLADMRWVLWRDLGLVLLAVHLLLTKPRAGSDPT